MGFGSDARAGVFSWGYFMVVNIRVIVPTPSIRVGAQCRSSSSNGLSCSVVIGACLLVVTILYSTACSRWVVIRVGRYFTNPLYL